tara:strand:+ start:774 stop:968 length:195 start_codon:yes stop_codon:yes gene_type:complete
MKFENIDIYFKLTMKQKRKLNQLGYSHVRLEQCSVADFESVTKNRELIRRFIEFKWSYGLKIVS